jgi:hypothetical protein
VVCSLEGIAKDARTFAGVGNAAHPTAQIVASAKTSQRAAERKRSRQEAPCAATANTKAPGMWY